MHAPGSDGVAGELRTLRRRIDELERRSPQGPICVNRLSNDLIFQVNQGQTPVTSWATPLVDTHGMFVYNEQPNGVTYWRIPVSGRYRISIVGVWKPFGGFDVNRPPWVSQAIYVGPQVVQEVATAVAPHLGSNDNSAPHTYNRLVNEDRLYVKDEIVRFQFYSRYGGTLLQKYGDAYTYVSLSHVGSR